VKTFNDSILITPYKAIDFGGGSTFPKNNITLYNSGTPSTSIGIGIGNSGFRAYAAAGNDFDFALGGLSGTSIFNIGTTGNLTMAANGNLEMSGTGRINMGTGFGEKIRFLDYGAGARTGIGTLAGNVGMHFAIQGSDDTRNFVFSSGGDIATPTNNVLTIFGNTGRVLIGSGTTAAASARLDITSTTAGFLPPRLTATQRNAIATPAAGLMVYDTDSSRYMLYGSAWKGLAYTDAGGGGGGTPAGSNTQIQYNNSGAFGAASTFVYNGALGVGTASPAASAVVDVTSTTKGFLFPRMTTTQRNAITSPAEGLVVYDLTWHSILYYNGTNWIEL
jgi:hypothetical protein